MRTRSAGPLPHLPATPPALPEGARCDSAVPGPSSMQEALLAS